MCKYLKCTARNNKTKADYSKPEKRIICFVTPILISTFAPTLANELFCNPHRRVLQQ